MVIGGKIVNIKQIARKWSFFSLVHTFVIITPHDWLLVPAMTINYRWLGGFVLSVQTFVAIFAGDSIRNANLYVAA